MKAYKHDEQELAEYVKGWKALINGPAEVTTMQRTPSQNKSLHKYCQMVADDMNAAGYVADEVISLPIRLTGDLVKDCIFRRIMSALYKDKESTTELSTTEIQDVYLNMSRALGEKFGITTPWPSEESLSEEQREA